MLRIIVCAVSRVELGLLPLARFARSGGGIKREVYSNPRIELRKDAAERQRSRSRAQRERR